MRARLLKALVLVVVGCGAYRVLLGWSGHAQWELAAAGGVEGLGVGLIVRELVRSWRPRLAARTEPPPAGAVVRSLALLERVAPIQAGHYRELHGILVASRLFPDHFYFVTAASTELVARHQGVMNACVHLCIHVRDRDLPIGDQLLAHKCAIEGDERGYLKTANVSPLTPCIFQSQVLAERR